MYVLGVLFQINHANTLKGRTLEQTFEIKERDTYNGDLVFLDDLPHISLRNTLL